MLSLSLCLAALLGICGQMWVINRKTIQCLADKAIVITCEAAEVHEQTQLRRQPGQITAKHCTIAAIACEREREGTIKFTHTLTHQEQPSHRQQSAYYHCSSPYADARGC